MDVWMLTSSENDPQERPDYSETRDICLAPGLPFLSEQAAKNEAQKEYRSIYNEYKEAYEDIADDLRAAGYLDYGPLTWTRDEGGLENVQVAVSEELNMIWQVCKMEAK